MTRIPSEQTIKAELKRLRQMVETSNDPIERRLAYTMEHAIRWARQPTCGWTKPSAEIKDVCKMLSEGI